MQLVLARVWEIDAAGATAQQRAASMTVDAEKS